MYTVQACVRWRGYYSYPLLLTGTWDDFARRTMSATYVARDGQVVHLQGYRNVLSQAAYRIMTMLTGRRVHAHPRCVKLPANGMTVCGMAVCDVDWTPALLEEHSRRWDRVRRWDKVRRWVKARSVVFYWEELTAHQMQEGGTAYRRDVAEAARMFA